MTDQRRAIAAALAEFESHPPLEAATRLFGTLGYCSDKRLALDGTPEGFLDTFDLEVGIQHQAGHGNPRNGVWTRFYQEDGNTQIFRLHKGDYQFRDRSREQARRGRVEAYTMTLEVEPGTWREWEGTYTLIKPIGAAIFQMFYAGGQLWAFHLGMSPEGDIGFNRRRAVPGKEKQIMIAENMVGKPLSIKVRTNGFDYKVYKKRPLVDEDWKLVTDGSYKRAKDNKIQFRWGMYLGQKHRGTPVPKDALYFVSGTTIR